MAVTMIIVAWLMTESVLIQISVRIILIYDHNLDKYYNINHLRHAPSLHCDFSHSTARINKLSLNSENSIKIKNLENDEVKPTECMKFDSKYDLS